MGKIGEVLSLLVASILQMIDNILRAIFGSKAPSLARALSKVTADDIMNGYKYAAREQVTLDRKAASEIGVAVHKFASAQTPVQRALIDLSALSDAQRDWLLTMSDENLSRLAKLNAYACEKAASGKKCGVVGLPVPALPEPSVIVRRQRDETPFALRMRAMKDVYTPSLSM